MSISKILIKRDGLSEDEANSFVAELTKQLEKMVYAGESVTEIEEYFSDETGLEPDYLWEIIC